MEYCHTTVDRQPSSSCYYVSFCSITSKPDFTSNANFNFLLFEPDVHLLPCELPNRHQLFQPKILRSEAHWDSPSWRII